MVTDLVLLLLSIIMTTSSLLPVIGVRPASLEQDCRSMRGPYTTKLAEAEVATGCGILHQSDGWSDAPNGSNCDKFGHPERDLHNFRTDSTCDICGYYPALDSKDPVSPFHMGLSWSEMAAADQPHVG
jgi:hypothetical protein